MISLNEKNIQDPAQEEAVAAQSAEMTAEELDPDEAAALKQSKTADMTVGSPLKLLVTFSIPLLAGGIFQLLYSIVDAIVVGRFIGADALAAVGVTNSAAFLVFSISNGLCIAVSVVIGQCFGAKNYSQMRSALANFIYLGLIACVIISIGSIYGAMPLLRLLGTPSNIIRPAAVYIQITCGLYIAQMAYNIVAGVLRAVGDSKTPLYFLIFCSLLNGALAVFFVLCISRSVASAGSATIISQAVSAVLCIIYMIKKYPILRIKRPEARWDGKVVKRLLFLGLPMMLQFSVLAIGMMVITGVTNSFGSDIVAAYTVGGRVEQIASLTFSQVAMSFSIYSSQNFGANNFPRIKQGFKQAFFIVFGLSAISSIVILIFGHDIVRLFVDASAAFVLTASAQMIRVEASCYVFLGVIWFYNGALRGMGDMRILTVSTFVELIIKVCGSIFFSMWFGYTGIWFAAPLGWILGAIPGFVRFHFTSWEKLRQRQAIG